MQKTLVIILGPHAVGKMTVGQELTKITPLRLFHNHMSIELTRKIFKRSETEWQILNSTIRRKVFELFAEGDFPGLIFTYMCAFEMPEEFDYLLDIIALFKKNGATCHVVELCADFDVRIERNKSENRLLHGRIHGHGPDPSPVLLQNPLMLRQNRLGRGFLQPQLVK